MSTAPHKNLVSSPTKALISAATTMHKHMHPFELADNTVLKVDGSGDTITMNKDSPVCVVGSWDGFSHSRSMIHNEQSNAFGVALDLRDGEYDYKYTCGGAWCLDPSREAFADASGAHKNHRVAVVHDMSTIKPCLDPAPHRVSPRASPCKPAGTSSASAHSLVHAGCGAGVGTGGGGSYAAAAEHTRAVHCAAAVQPSPGRAGVGAAIQSTVTHAASGVAENACSLSS